MNLLAQIESILFVASKPLSIRELTKATGVSVAKIEETLETLKMKYNREDSGIHLIFQKDEIRMATNPENAQIIQGFIKEETRGELTKAQLETLTVIAYRSPITRLELEQIRGVNCAVILRNLLIRGLIEESTKQDELLPKYSISLNALAHLGISNISELPNYSELSQHENINEILKEQ